MVSGFPVPLQLLLPIFTAFASSFAPPSFQPYRRTPFCFDNRFMMDPEPGRCRRTDGKKWRCHQSVLPNEKYCEKHMHRGSKRSRKLVEASSIGPASSSRTTNLMNVNRNYYPNNDLRIRFPTKLDQKSHMSGNIEGKGGPTRVVIRGSSLSNSVAKRNEKNEQDSAGIQNIVMKETIVTTNPSSGLDFSPKSVLQGHKCPRVEILDNKLKSEQGRCRRTDGKKWQCSKEVIPDHKYCARHIHRGSRKPDGEAKDDAYGSNSSAVKFSGPEWAKMGLGSGSGFDTNLNVAVPTSPAKKRHDIEDSVAGNGGGSGSITETTITDDSTNVSQ